MIRNYDPQQELENMAAQEIMDNINTAIVKTCKRKAKEDSDSNFNNHILYFKYIFPENYDCEDGDLKFRGHWTKESCIKAAKDNWEWAEAKLKEVNNNKINGFNDWKIPNKEDISTLFMSGFDEYFYDDIWLDSGESFNIDMKEFNEKANKVACEGYPVHLLLIRDLKRMNDVNENNEKKIDTKETKETKMITLNNLFPVECESKEKALELFRTFADFDLFKIGLTTGGYVETVILDEENTQIDCRHYEANSTSALIKYDEEKQEISMDLICSSEWKEFMNKERNVYDLIHEIPAIYTHFIAEKEYTEDEAKILDEKLECTNPRYDEIKRYREVLNEVISMKNSKKPEEKKPSVIEVKAPAFDMISSSQDILTWEDAVKFAESYEFEGIKDWRIASFDELKWMFENHEGMNFEFDGWSWSWRENKESGSFEVFESSLFKDENFERHHRRHLAKDRLPFFLVRGKGFENTNEIIEAWNRIKDFDFIIQDDINKDYDYLRSISYLTTEIKPSKELFKDINFKFSDYKGGKFRYLGNICDKIVNTDKNEIKAIKETIKLDDALGVVLNSVSDENTRNHVSNLLEFIIKESYKDGAFYGYTQCVKDHDITDEIIVRGDMLI